VAPYFAELRERKHVVLLLVSILMLIAQPLAHGIVAGLVVYDVLLTLVLLGVFLIIFKPGWERHLALVIAVPTIISRWAAYALASDYQWIAAVVHHGLVLVFLSLAVGLILRGLFEGKVIRTDHFLGTVCGFVLAGVAWGNCYVLAELFVPGSFSVKPEIAWQLKDEHMRSFLFNYFSLCTLTGVGYGDVTPIRPGIASLTWLEAMFGQFYIAVVVAQLVGLKLAQAIDASRWERD
jgi:voltage-gated potassium channel